MIILIVFCVKLLNHNLFNLVYHSSRINVIFFISKFLPVVESSNFIQPYKNVQLKVIGWDKKEGVVNYELLKPNEILTAERY